MTTDIPADSSGSLSNLSISDDDLSCNNEALQSDTWIEELECALLADCDPATLKKICEGKRIPASLRPDYWRTLLALNDAERVKLASEYDLPNQSELRRDCELLVEDISTNIASEPLSNIDKLRLRSDFESTLTTYVKARPELEYVSGNGWTDILKVLYNLGLSDSLMYQMFFRIVDRYIPKDLSTIASAKVYPSANINENLGQHQGLEQQTSAISKADNTSLANKKQATDKICAQQQNSAQAYHLLRLLIQYHDPELCSILDSKKLTPDLYVKDWFCSLFSRNCPPKLALHMWDMHFKMADPFLIFFAAIVMVVNASEALKKIGLSQEDMLAVLKKMPDQLEEEDIEDLYYLVSNHYTNTTPRSIRSYSHLFFMDTFGATYTGNESPELGGSPPLVDLRTCRLTSSLDLSQYLCLPIVPAEIFALETIQQRASPINSMSNNNEGQALAHSSDSESPTAESTSNVASSTTLRYFLVDCRPAEQYNAGHLTKAFHLDCSLMLREPSSFATAVQALLEIQRQVVASKSSTGGQHLCFIGSGHDEEDRYVNMVVASFLQKYQKYVSIVHGGFDSIHDYVQTKSELSCSFNKYIVDHNESFCKVCCSKSPEAYERLQVYNRAQQLTEQHQRSNSFSAQSLLASTTGFFTKSDKTASAAANALSKFTTSNPQAAATAQQLAQSGASIFDKFTNAFMSKSSVLKDRLVETINNTSLPSAAANLAATTGRGTSFSRGHVSSQDRLGPRYMGNSTSSLSSSLGGGFSTRVTDEHSRDQAISILDEEPCQEVQIDQWQRDNGIIALYKCSQIKGANRYPGFIGLDKTHLWILREIPHNKGIASIAAKRPLNMVVQITSKRRQPDFIIFRYGYASKSPSSTSAPASTDSELELGKPEIETYGQQRETGQQSNRGTTNNSASSSDTPKKGLPTIIGSDNLHIPQAFEVIRLIRRAILRILDENSRPKVCAPEECAN